MFKKSPQPQASANIKSSERRKLLYSICEIYDVPQSNITKECELNILPIATKKANFKSIQGYNGIIYYNNNETPIWFKSRDSQVYPSIFTLWKCPFLLPIVKTHPHVISIIANGADLMLPGTIPPFDKKCTKGSIVGIVDSENSTVIKAVGICKLDLTQFNNVIGKTGIAVEIIHHINDELYQLNKLIDIPVPTKVNLYPELKDVEDNQIEPLEKDEAEQEEIQSDGKDTGIAITFEDIAEEVSQLSLEEIDNFFNRSLLQTIKLETIDLPISSSTFMSSYIYKNLPQIDPEYCNIKKTSWKKTAKFLKAMDKLNYLTIKGKGDDVSITKLMPKEDPLITNFITHRISSSKNSSAHGIQPTAAKRAHEMSVIQLYKPTSKSRMFFNKVDESFSSYYTSNDLRSLLDKYVRNFELVNQKNPKQIIIDDILNSITSVGVGSTPRDKAFKSFLSNFSPYYKIIKPSELSEDALLYKGVPSKVSIVTEMKIGRKTITRMVNFEQFYIKPHILADELKVKCSGSSTIAPCVQNPKLTEVTVQGPHGKLIIELLKEKGVPVSFIEFDDRLKKKKRKS